MKITTVNSFKELYNSIDEGEQAVVTWIANNEIWCDNVCKKHSKLLEYDNCIGRFRDEFLVCGDINNFSIIRV